MSFVTVLSLLFLNCASGGLGAENPNLEQLELPQKNEIALFTSSDSDLTKSYAWARKTALAYAHDASTDPVGPWYEAALPQREAFCMRDVAHQTVGGQILGLSKQNKNMMFCFANNMTENKDWCSYWEIDRHKNPCPADYRNDREFWYVLNANFDVIQACLKLYKWSGDDDYLTNRVLLDFYEKSLGEYVVRWVLEPENLMTRPRYMNSPPNFNPNDPFHYNRGLASYAENVAGITMSADLIATIYAGYKAYAEICRIQGDDLKSAQYAVQAEKYKDILNEKWWGDGFFHTHWIDGKRFYGDTEGLTYLVWFDAVDDPRRIKAVLENSLLSRRWNIENTSHFPLLAYRYNYEAEASELLKKFPDLERSEYPEASYGVVEGFVSGMMGITPDADKRRVATCSHLCDATDWAKIANVPLFNGFVTVKHTGKVATEFLNNSDEKIVWRATFAGVHGSIRVNEEELAATVFEDRMGACFSYVDVELAPRAMSTANL